MRLLRGVAIGAAAWLSACALGPAPRGGPSLLDDYRRAGSAFALAEIPNDLSGISYSPESGTHFLVENGAGNLYEYSSDLRSQLRKFRLVGGPSRDFEAVAVLGNSKLALAHEQNRVVIVTIPAADADTELSVDPNDPEVQELVLPTRAKRNRGLEGLCYDAAGNAGGGTFYAVQESSPRRIYRFDRPADGANASVADGSLRVQEPFDAEEVFSGIAEDLSGCAYDPRSGRLLVLSHLSSVLVDVSTEGEVVRVLRLPGVLRRGAVQYEGITLGPGGKLFLVSESALFQRASRALIYEYTGAGERSNRGRDAERVEEGPIQ
ncbi:MAG: SdiA-regulated domain-containing protein [Myxococcales bacterium]|nr:SdiA-regulated domain-containing protein [Myxococcales bacterium]